MEDKNRELNAEELEQGAGGRGPSDESYQRRIYYLKEKMKSAKRIGKSKEEFFMNQSYDLTAEEEEKLSALWDNYH